MESKKKIKIIINDRRCSVEIGQTILEAAKANKVEIPSLCYHFDLRAKANCRLCVVEIKGQPGLFPACSTQIEEGQEIITESPKISRARKINLEFIFSQHSEECYDCVWDFNCQLLKLVKKYQVQTKRFIDRKTDWPVYQFGSSIIFDSSKCVDCQNCVEICEKQGVGFLKKIGRGSQTKITPNQDKNIDCVYCGQCLVHCPAGAIEAGGELEDIEKPLKLKNKIVVAQIAPAIRVSLNEEFGLTPNSLTIEKISAAMKQIGFSKVFDVSSGADITTIEESKEFMGRWKNQKNLPMFTSCCPAWVKFIEFYYPEFIPNLTATRSPHIISGGVIKTFWAEQNKINPKDIVVVSVMPCTAKKYEVTRKELNINGLKPVDYVLTTRELSRLLSKNKIDFKKIKPQKLDYPLGDSSENGVTYGISGGAIKSAISDIYYNLTGKNIKNLKFKPIKGIDRAQIAEIKIGQRKIKVVTVNGLGSLKKFLFKIKKNPKFCDYLEAMACFDGCIGGGGQPLPTDKESREKRKAFLSQIGRSKKIKLAADNPAVKKIYQKFLNNKKQIYQICQTKYFPKQKKQGFDILSPGHR
jgi:iron-only hydrogenase group A